MKKQALTMLNVLLMLTALSISVQSQQRVVINIPFNFIVGQKTLPAGEYGFKRIKIDSETVWLVQSRDRRASILFMTIPVRAAAIQEETKLIFHRYGGQYFLSQIWTPGDNTGRELLKPRLERELAKNPAEQRTIALIAHRP